MAAEAQQQHEARMEAPLLCAGLFGDAVLLLKQGAWPCADADSQSLLLPLLLLVLLQLPSGVCSENAHGHQSMYDNHHLVPFLAYEAVCLLPLASS